MRSPSRSTRHARPLTAVNATMCATLRLALRSVMPALLCVSPLAAQSRPMLIPKPREMTERPAVSLRGGVSISSTTDRDDRFTARDLEDALRERGITVKPANGVTGDDAVRVTLSRTTSAAGRAALLRAGLRIDSAMTRDGYLLVADGGRVDVVAASPAGLFYGVQTLKQLIDGRGANARLNGARIRDWPAMRYRGLHDDLSRGPVPTLEYQKRQIRTLAAFKYNVYSPYYEHTLAYNSNPLIAPPGGAMTREQVKELIAYAKQYYIDVIPEQEAFGHLHHMLKYETYSPLGETQHGHVLAPDNPGSMPLIRQMFAEIDTVFSSPFIHLGADETFELGRGQTRERVQKDGIGAVYLDFLKKIELSLRPTNKTLLFWGDVAMNHPDLVKTLPKDLVAVAWWYDPLPSFDKYLVPFKDAGMTTWVAPGVNNWNRVWPNFSNALTNIRNFVRDGQRLGSVGMLNTSWDDDGEAIFDQTWYAIAFGGAAAWQPGESSIEDFQRSFGRVFHGDTTGSIDEAQRKLMKAHDLLKEARVGDASDYLFWLDPWSTEGVYTAERLRPVTHQLRLLAEDAIVLIAKARQQPLRETSALDAMELGARRVSLIGMKFQLADEIAQAYGRAVRATTDTALKLSPVRDLGDITGPNGRMQDLRDQYAVLRDLYEAAWLRENRPYWMHSVITRYDMATQLWIERGDRVNQARQKWYRDRKPLPSPSSLGIPESAATADRI